MSFSVLWCERRDLNPHVETPDPKSGASANSATLAGVFVLYYYGAAYRSRTNYLLITSQLLYQVS